jgi:hypothetical protein
MRAVSSPRLSRRLVRWSIGVAGLGGIVLVFALVPEQKQPGRAATGKPGSAKVARPVNLRVRPGERRAVDNVLDRFIPAGVGRRAMTRAWRLAGPELRAGSTLRQWRNDVSPIPYYPVAGKTFHDWTTLDAGPNFVEFALQVFPRRGSHLGAWAFSGLVVRRHSRWLVDRLYTAATYNTAGALTGPPDLIGGLVNSGAPSNRRGPGIGSGAWIVCSVVILLLILPAFLFSAFLWDGWPRRRGPNRPLPPLPMNVASRRR